MIEIKEIIRANKLKKDPNSINWFEVARDVARSIADKIIPERFAEMRAELKKEAGETLDTLMREKTKDLTPENLRGPKGPIGLRGPKGDTVVGPPGPTGPMPSKEDLEEIIKPLIPEVKNGETPSDSRLVKLIKPLLPKKKDLLALIKPLVAIFEERLNRKVADIVKRGGGSKPAGGGLGNIQHESKSVTSASTTVSTNSKIAGSGYAIWAYYQGQLIMRGVHYTVGTDQKTLTLLFTPQDSTTIDIIYVRT